MQDRAELVSRLVLFQEWRPGEGDVGSIGQRLPHPLMGFAAVAPVSFVHQNDDVGAWIEAFRHPGGRGELVDDREQDALAPMADAMGQVFPGHRFCLFDVPRRGQCAGIGENLTELVFQVDAVSNHKETAPPELFVQQ